MVEIYQNCNVFNDGAFFGMTDKDTKAEQTMFVEHGKPMIFANGEKGIKLDGFNPVVVSMDSHNEKELWVHDQYDRTTAGYVNFCPNQLANHTDNWEEQHSTVTPTAL